MQTISFSLSGSGLLLILLVLCVVVFTIYTYLNTNPVISKGKRILLSCLRSFALSILLFAVFEPILTKNISNEVKPKYAVLIDNSKSMAIKDAGGNRKDKFDIAIKSLNLADENDNKVIGKFDNELKYISNFALDSLQLDGENTDIANAISSINYIKNTDNVQSVVLVSDGNFNLGNNPLYEAEKSGKKFYVIGIGDTTTPKDILIHSVINNEFAYIDNVMPITVNINYSGFDNSTTKLKFYEDNKLIEERIINLDKKSNSTSEYIEYTPKSDGTKKLSFKIDGFDDELNKENNSIAKYVKVLKNKRRISLFAGYATPDISFIKNVLTNQKGLEFQEYVQKIGAEFYNNPSPEDIANTELFIFVGFPISTTPNNILELIAKQLSLGKPILFIGGLKTDYQKLKKIEDYLPFNIASSQAREFQILADFYPNAISSPILRIEGDGNDLSKWNNLAPIFRTETFVRTKPESQVLAGIKINNTPINEALIVSRDIQNKKSLAILAYGLYRWKLNSYAEEIAKGRTETLDLYDIFIINSLRWLSVNEQSQRIRIQPLKKFFSEDEPVEFIAQIYDASYTPIDNATITVKIKVGDGSRDLILTQVGNGRYYGAIDNLAKGDYSFNGFAEKNNQKIGSDDGRFSIGGLNAEYRDLQMNYNLLKNIAEYTGGKYYDYKQADKLLTDLKNTPSFKSTIVTTKSDIQLWNNWILMMIAISLLSIEWLLRKRAGLL
ncbi:MAG TPA: vWA domain-containing protein [Candidatus Kapabacteria bacterium]|nr:vWA domain-containing protein [Candidatus Kapabacteria bacterium]